MSPSERRHDRRTLIVWLLADASTLGLLITVVVWRYRHTGLSPLDVLFAWFMLMGVVLFFAHLDSLWQGRHARHPHHVHTERHPVQDTRPRLPP